jgi:hypothetical protein
MLRLFGVTVSPFFFKVMRALEIKGLDYELVALGRSSSPTSPAVQTWRCAASFARGVPVRRRSSSVPSMRVAHWASTWLGWRTSGPVVSGTALPRERRSLPWLTSGAAVAVADRAVRRWGPFALAGDRCGRLDRCGGTL